MINLEPSKHITTREYRMSHKQHKVLNSVAEWILTKIALPLTYVVSVCYTMLALMLTTVYNVEALLVVASNSMLLFIGFLGACMVTIYTTKWVVCLITRTAYKIIKIADQHH